MKTIIPAQEHILQVLGKPAKGDTYRLMYSVVRKDVPEGVLLFHMMTGELLLLTCGEYEHRYELPALYEKWFLVPEKTDDCKLIDQARAVLRMMRKKTGHITGYTVFTTTECNARCFYCYEKGIRQHRMSTETALETVEFIARNCGGEPVRLRWFGGEPLYNAAVIDIITNALRERNITFRSNMISNGYLLNTETVKKAKEQWKLTNVQITLDGTRDVYNRTKAYIYEDGGDPFETVLSNIGSCLENGIRVNVRMNMTEANAQDLKELVRQLSKRFGENPYLSVYSAVLFQIAHGDSNHAAVVNVRQRELEERIIECHLNNKGPLPKGIRLNSCMADNENSVTVLPDGRLGCCEHDVDTTILGNIREGITDKAAAETYRELTPREEACAHCFYYPVCVKLKKCEAQPCTAHFREILLINTGEKIKNAFFSKAVCDEEADTGNC